MNPRQEVAAVDELHREKPLIALREELVELHDVRVRDVGEGSKLPLEPEERARVEVRHRLQGHDFATLDVAHLMDHPHPPFAESTFDHEAAGALKSVDRSEHASRCRHVEARWGDPVRSGGPKPGGYQTPGASGLWYSRGRDRRDGGRKYRRRRGAPQVHDRGPASRRGQLERGYRRRRTGAAR